MSHASRWAKAIAIIILVLVGLYAAHFTARIKIADEHVAFSRAALLVPFSGTVGEFVTCTYGRLWDVKCTDPQGNEALKAAQAMNLPELQHLDLTVRYLCAADPVRQSLECGDRNMVGTAAILTALAGLLGATAIAFDASRLPNRRSSVFAVVRHGICTAASLLLLWHVSRVTPTTIWMGTIDERIIATRPILAFTGNVIGYGILIAVTVIGIVGAMSAAATLARR
jgi:hypothetical protein